MHSGDLKRELEQSRALLLLDGLDELGREREDSKTKERYDPRLRFLQKIPKNGRILLTCRREDYAQIGNKVDLKGAITLKPLTSDQIENYLYDQLDLWEVVKNDPALLDILKTPLFLRIVAYAFRGRPAELTGLRDLREGVLRDAIFTAYIERRYEHESLKYDEPEKELPFTLDDLWRDLGRIAMLNAAGDDVTTNVLTERDFWRVVGSSRSKVFIEFCQQLNLITSAGEQTCCGSHAPKF